MHRHLSVETSKSLSLTRRPELTEGIILPHTLSEATVTKLQSQVQTWAVQHHTQTMRQRGQWLKFPISIPFILNLQHQRSSISKTNSGLKAFKIILSGPLMSSQQWFFLKRYGKNANGNSNCCIPHHLLNCRSELKLGQRVTIFFYLIFSVKYSQLCPMAL